MSRDVSQSAGHGWFANPRYHSLDCPAPASRHPRRSRNDQLRNSYINDLFSIVVGIIRIVSAKAKPMEITPQSLLLEELALDSLDLVRVIMLIEDRYHTAVDLDEIPKMKRVDDMTRILSRELRSAA